MIGGTIFAIGAGIPFPLMGILFGQLVDDLNAATCAAQSEDLNTDAFEYQDTINSTVGKLAYIAAAQFVLIYLHNVCWNIQSQRLAHRLRERYFRHLLRQEPAFFDDKHAGDVSARLNDDFAAIQAGTNEKVGRLLGQLSFFVTAYIVAFTRIPKLAGMPVSLLPAYLILTAIGSRYLKRFATISGDSFSGASSIASEALSNIPVVQAFGAGPRLEAKFARHLALARKWGIKKALVAAFQAGMLYLIAYSSNSLAYWQGSVMIAEAIDGKGSATVGQVYTVVFLLVDGTSHTITIMTN